jgi:hypothetical protein
MNGNFLFRKQSNPQKQKLNSRVLNPSESGTGFSDFPIIALKKVFLRAEWRKLLLVNYPIDPRILEPFLPAKTELDFFEGKCLVSMVGFMFMNTRLKGIPVPFHQNFEEVNLRFYVRYKEKGICKRGAVFIGEFVPKPLIALVARTVYKEPYSYMPMKNEWDIREDGLDVSYHWKTKRWNSLIIKANCQPFLPEPDSEAAFILEHYWGYTRLGPHRTAEYGVEHPSWMVYPTIKIQADLDFEENYGPAFAVLNHTKPVSAFLAEGSEILVRHGRLI